MKFGLMFFAASDESLTADRYRLVLDSGRFADAHGFSSVWVPERHFTRFGGLYPNPAVLHAALAACTERVHLRAGSVVAPLHHPLRIAEEWSVVDNLSNGRVGVSFASGWNPDDFAFFPERYADRHDRVFDTMEAVRRLWRGDAIEATNGTGRPTRVRSYPTPVQRELPVWITAAGNPRTFERAGASGAHLLTHLLDQDEDDLAAKIVVYRNARAAAGLDPGTGEVSLMLHTFVGSDAARVREEARGPYCEYIKANLGLLNGLARSRGRDADVTSMSPADREAFVNWLYDRFAAERGLIGTPESCLPLVSRLEAVGVTELACLLDFGPPVEQVLANLVHLHRLKTLHADTVRAAHASAADDAPRLAAFAAADVQARCAIKIRGRDFHAALRRHGVEISGDFDRLRTIWRRDGEALAAVDAGHAATDVASTAVLDACSRVLAAALPSTMMDGAADTLFVPAGMRACRVLAPMVGSIWSHAVVTGGSPEGGFSGDVTIYDAAGRVLVTIESLRLEPVARADAPAIDVTPLVYERAWRRAKPVDGTPDIAGRWVIAGRGTDDPLARELHALLANGGRHTDSPAPVPRGIVFVAGGIDGANAAADAGHMCRELLALVQAHPTTPIWIVTTGVVEADGSAPVAPQHAPLWGLGRVLAVERPALPGGLVDLDPASAPAAAARQIVATIGDAAGESMTAWRGGVRFVPRLRRLAAISAAAQAPAFDGTVLITGGTGGLGLRVAAWVVQRGARHVLLVGRHAASRAATAAIDELTALGADMAVIQADVANFDELDAAVLRGLAGRPPLCAVFHLAGVLDDARIEAQTWERAAAVLAPKVDGAWNLHRLTERLPLTHFVMFSSAASLVPVPGEGAYAAANAFLDALAHLRRARGLPALAVNWGPWAEAGHAATEYGRSAHAQLATLGIAPLPPTDALAALDRLIRSGTPQAAVIDVDWAHLFAVDPAAARLGLLSELADAAASSGARSTPSDTALAAALRQLPAAARKAHLMRHLSDVIVAAVKLPAGTSLEPRQRLFDTGLDSILAIDVKTRLEEDLGRPLSATLLFVHPTLDALATFLLAETAVADAPPADRSTGDLAALSEQELAALVLREIDGGR